MASALYLHIPFCARKCAYCDFSSWETRRGDPVMAAYARSLMKQVGAVASIGILDGCETIYVGGGTPTLLGADSLAKLVAYARQNAPDAYEISCEANPDSLDEDMVSALASAGVTRVSVGVQSLVDGELSALGRLHTASQAKRSVRSAAASGLDVSIDLMCAIPQQNDLSWDETLKQSIDLGIGHISVYPLSIEEGTRLYERYGEDAPFNSEDVQAQRMERAEQLLTGAGLARYEVASYARPHRECVHNMAYWTGVPYMGLGTGAASMLDRERYDALRIACPQLPEMPVDVTRIRLSIKNGRQEIARDDSLKSLHFDIEALDGRQAWAEDLMLGVRLCQGVDKELVPGGLRERLQMRGLVVCEDGMMRPTRDGWLLGNELYGELWNLAQASVLEFSC